MAPDSVWEIVFLMLILKIPIVYLCTVIYLAIKAEPKPEAPAGVTAQLGPEGDDGGSRRVPRRRPQRPLRPHGRGPARRYPRAPEHIYARRERS